VQTIPCRARTSDRVAKFFPVIRSIWAEEVLANAEIPISKMITRLNLMSASVTPQRAQTKSRLLSDSY